MLHSSISRNEKPDDDWCQEKEGRKKVGIFMHMCSPRCDDLFSLGYSVWVACGAELWPRKVCVCAGSSFALRSCTACPCSYVFMWHSGRSRDT